MRQLLRMIVVYGTGRKANAPGFRVGGKTGSAEKPGAGGYQQDLAGRDLRRRLPDGPAALRRDRHARRAAGHRRQLVPAHRRLERRAGGRPGGAAHRPAARRDARREPRHRHHRPRRRWSREGGRANEAGRSSPQPRPGSIAATARIARRAGDRLRHRSPQGRARHRVRRLSRARAVNGEDFIPAAVAAGAVAVVARPEAQVAGAVAHRRSASRAAPSRGSPRGSSRPVPETIVAVTGTNGKTSTVEMTRQLWRMAGDARRLDRHARRHHARRERLDRADHARHRHLPAEHDRARARGRDPCRLRGVEPRPVAVPQRGAARWPPGRSPTSAATTSTTTPTWTTTSRPRCGCSTKSSADGGAAVIWADDAWSASGDRACRARAA